MIDKSCPLISLVHIFEGNQMDGKIEPKPLPSSKNKDARQWAMFLHLSLLAGCVVPGAGLVVPIVIWQVKKEEYPELDQHGKAALNWILSLLIYSLIGIVLACVYVGFFILIALGICSVVFPIIAGIKANEGVLWQYPLAIRFL